MKETLENLPVNSEITLLAKIKVVPAEDCIGCIFNSEDNSKCIKCMEYERSDHRLVKYICEEVEGSVL